MGGYSLTPLVRKLGFKEDMSVCLINAPEEYLKITEDLPPGCDVRFSLRPESDLVHIFVRDIEDLHIQINEAKESISKKGALWVSWPKKSSAHYKDLDGNTVREIGLGAGLVDVKVCAIDDTWSALRFVYRVKDR